MYQIKRIGGDPETDIKEARFQGASFPPHFHDTYSIGLITQGLEDITHDLFPSDFRQHAGDGHRSHEIHGIHAVQEG
jgi:hypothetical protein